VFKDEASLNTRRRKIDFKWKKTQVFQSWLVSNVCMMWISLIHFIKCSSGLLFNWIFEFHLKWSQTFFTVEDEMEVGMIYFQSLSVKLLINQQMINCSCLCLVLSIRCLWTGTGPKHSKQKTTTVWQQQEGDTCGGGSVISWSSRQIWLLASAAV